MARKKTELFTEQEVELARFARAMAHPARISIVTLLLEKGECCCGEIVKHLPLAQPTVSQHLKELREADVLNAKECGLKVCYTLNRKHMDMFCMAMQTTLCKDINV